MIVCLLQSSSLAHITGARLRLNGMQRVHRGRQRHFGGLSPSRRVADLVHFLDVGHQVVLDGEPLLTNVTDFRLDVLVDADHVALQVGGGDECLFAPVARVPLQPLVYLNHVPVENVAEGKGSIALIAFELVSLVPLSHVLLKLPLVAERAGALVAVPLFHVLMDDQLVGAQLLGFEKPSLANVTVVSPDSLVNLETKVLISMGKWQAYFTWCTVGLSTSTFHAQMI